MRHIALCLVAFVLLTGFMVKTDGKGRELKYALGNPITVCVKGGAEARHLDMEKGLAVWTSTASSLTFVMSEEGALGCQITVEMVPSGELKDPNALGETTPALNSRIGLVNYIRMNADKLWSAPGKDPCSNEYDFTTVFAHEVGHAIGLDHVEDKLFPDALMRHYRGAQDLHRYLGSIDRAGRDYLYPIIDETGPDAMGGCTCLVVPLDDHRLTSVVIMFMMAGWVYRRRRPVTVREL